MPGLRKDLVHTGKQVEYVPVPVWCDQESNPHNRHCSGCCDKQFFSTATLWPSKEDDAITHATTHALQPLGIKLLDHVIVTRFGYYSYRAQEQNSNRIGYLSKLDEGEVV